MFWIMILGPKKRILELDVYWIWDCLNVFASYVSRCFLGVFRYKLTYTNRIEEWRNTITVLKCQVRSLLWCMQSKCLLVCRDSMVQMILSILVHQQYTWSGYRLTWTRHFENRVRLTSKSVACKVIVLMELKRKLCFTNFKK